jgi:hypothetical protein
VIFHMILPPREQLLVCILLKETVPIQIAVTLTPEYLQQLLSAEHLVYMDTVKKELTAMNATCMNVPTSVTQVPALPKVANYHIDTKRAS